MPFLVRIYLLTQAWFRKGLAVAWAGAWACFTGFWLGVFSKEGFHAIDEEYYTRSKRGESGQTRVAVRPGEPNYYSEDYNRSGLWDWEQESLTAHFVGCKRLLLIGAGGGRETLALLKQGYDVDSFESHPHLVAAANELLRSEGYTSVVRPVPRDAAPSTETTYDGIIVGWGMYMLVHGKAHRISLLRRLRAQTQPGAPILLSFYFRTYTPGAYKLAALVANVIRRLLGRQPVEVGDWLQPEYVHYFTQDEVAYELSEGGFTLVQYSTEGYGHAVGSAV